MKANILIAAALLMGAASAQAQQYDCLGSDKGGERVFSDRFSLETHQGLSELALMSEGAKDFTIVANYDANHPLPDDDSRHMTFKYITEGFKGSPLSVIVAENWMRVESPLFIEFCKQVSTREND